MHTIVFGLQESVSPVLWKFCNEIPLVFKVKFPGGSQSLCQISRLGNLLQALELLKQCENFFVIIVLQFVVVCIVALHGVMLHDPGLLQPEPLSPRQPPLTYASTGDTKILKSRSGSGSCGVPVSCCIQGFV